MCIRMIRTKNWRQKAIAIEQCCEGRNTSNDNNNDDDDKSNEFLSQTNVKFKYKSY